MKTFGKLLLKQRLKATLAKLMNSDFAITGIDVSMWQGQIDWTQVPDAFAIIKATEADSWVDPQYNANWQNAKANGKMRSAYHFFRPRVNVQAQIDNFCNTVGQWEPGDLPPMLDLEVPQDWAGMPAERCMDLIDQWCNGVWQRLGAKPYLYASASFIDGILQNNPRLGQYLLDEAFWTNGDSPSVPAPWSNWTFWQWTDSGYTPGIRGGVDQNRFNGSFADLQRLGFGYQGLVKQIRSALRTIGKRQPQPSAQSSQKRLVRPLLDNIIQYPSPNWDSRGRQRVVFLIEHYTAQGKEAALERLSDPAAQVSSHYLVDEEGNIYQLVAEENRAWHAGLSFWDGYTDINSVSIGIEIVNSGDAPYTEPQMQAVRALSLDIAQRHAIPPTHVLGHSDVAVTVQNHKSDPGWFFDWQSMAAQGVGVWPQPVQVDYDQSAGWSDDDVKRNLNYYGFTANADLPVLIEAFQRHFQQEAAQTTERIGVADADTKARLAYLLRFKTAGVRLF